MILPDMIYDHGLQLPDLADFPDAGEVTFPSDVDWLPFDGEFNQAMREHNIDKFQIAYTKLCMDIFSNVNLSPGAKAAAKTALAIMPGAFSVLEEGPDVIWSALFGVGQC